MKKTLRPYYPARSFRYALVLLCLALSACQSQVPHFSDSDAANIDHLLQLIDARLAVAPQVAQAKWNAGKSVDDAAREQRILDAVSQQAMVTGVDVLFAGDFFRAQIEANKLLQRCLLEQWRREIRPPFAEAPSLAAEVRPRLDRLTPQLLDALRGFPHVVAAPDAQQYLRQNADQYIRGDCGGKVRAAALQPLLLPVNEERSHD